MKRMICIASTVIALVSCAKEATRTIHEEADAETEQAVVEDVDPVRQKLAHLQRLRNEPMEKVIDETYEYEVPIRVFEKEEKYYLGFIFLRSNKQMVSGYDAELPIDFSVDSIRYEEDRMIFVMKRSLLELDENTQKLVPTRSGLVEVVINRDEYLSILEEYASGKSTSRRIETTGTIIKYPD